ncbi:hypothetical protein KIH74_06800 [Kineosporia sp. J2-2]|uniref:PpiC domain-containing protein n=1 Tax=Kineosporia corallincola TaxID=2835133 RepID=A0ABS5TEV8_9ACTN|nr:hypothetical protein [Kineosporia corallincola]MBT0768628.1 hypothetical protein [Kineosporia corallincola]
MKGRVLAGCLAVVTVACVCAGAAWALGGTDRVATLDGRAITRDELLFQMGRLDRTSAAQGDLPDQALDEIRSTEATLDLAREDGQDVWASFQDFLDEVETVNAARASAHARGEVVYGPVEYTPQEYYSHRLAEITTALEKDLSARPGDPLWVGDAEVRQAFDDDPGAWSANATTYEYTELELPVSADAIGDESLEDVPGGRLSSGTYTGGTSTGVNPRDQELQAVLGTLEPGQTSAPVVGSSTLTYYRLDHRNIDEEKAFAAYAPRIRQSLTGSKLRRLLDRREGASDFTVDSAAVDAIDAEDVQR